LDNAKVSDFKWLRLENYSFINELSVNDFIKEIEWRNTLFYLAEGTDVLNEADFEETIHFIRIFSGDPLLQVYSKEELFYNKRMDDYMVATGKSASLSRDRPLLPGDTGVSPVCFTELAFYNLTAIKQGAYVFDGDGNIEGLNPHYMLATVSKNIPEDMNHKLLLDLYLSEATDEEILSSIKNCCLNGAKCFQFQSLTFYHKEEWELKR
jgi:hypothetical protein